MSFKMIITDERTLAGLGDEVWKEVKPRYRRAVVKARDLVLNEAKRLLRQRRGPEPAPAGQPPAQQTRALVRSAKKLRPIARRGFISSGFEFTDPGSNRVEFGGVDSRGIRTFPHSFVRVAFDKKEAEVDHMLRNA